MKSRTQALSGESEFKKALEFTGDVSPSQEFARSYVEKFPVGKEVAVYYDPQAPVNATLEPGMRKGDWMVFAIGVGTIVFGLILLVFH